MWSYQKAISLKVKPARSVDNMVEEEIKQMQARQINVSLTPAEKKYLIKNNGMLVIGMAS